MTREETIAAITDAFYFSKDKPLDLYCINTSGARHFEWQGAIRDNSTYPMFVDAMEFVLAVCYDSDWWGQDERAKDADFFVVFKSESGMGYLQYTCAGYSSMTFEPETTRDFMFEGTFETVLKFCADDHVREMAYGILGRSIVE